jgi:hypothetical protein
MERISTPASGATTSDLYFIQRVHFEEDKYNLLASGSDWYGFRFFGTAGNTSFNLSLNYSGELAQTATMKVRFKSANGIEYSLPTNYRYWFTVYLNSGVNPMPLLLNANLGSRVGKTFSNSFNANDYILDGDNTVSIEYTGDREECEAHLDWFELYFPSNFQASNDYLMFYTNTLGQIVQYTVSNLSSNDMTVFDSDCAVYSQ